MKFPAAICAFLLSLPIATIAQTDAPTPGRELAELIYGAIEADPHGGADMGEFVTFGQEIFVSMDYDQNGSVDPKEFTDWDFGFNFIARDEGQQGAYETAQRILFALWDHDADGEINRNEYHTSLVTDFRRADTDGNAFLTREEFLVGYVVNLAYRAAITGQ